ncbi:MAG: HD domain-containing protein [Elusimicrobia bacterium]|nr:HD domain-containing protein [Elusimicrobiota bacterium]
MALKRTKIPADDSKKLRLLISFHRKSLLTRDREKLIELISLEIKEILEADRATFFMLDTAKNELYGKLALGLKKDHLKALRFPVSQGIAGYVARTGLPINVIDAYQSPYFNPEFDKITGFKTHSVVAAPLKDSGGRVLGVLAAFNKLGGKAFSDEDEGLLLLLASQLAATYEIFQLLEELKLSSLESIHALAQTAEFRDQEDTGPHINRVSTYSALLAQVINLPAGEVEVIRVISPLHDIGKVAIRDEILRKPGAFTPEEAAEMKKHAIRGYEMLQNFRSPLLRKAGQIALSHHEKFDGTGYPNKLKGEQIPLEARIVTLADSFDAMTSKRVYKAALSFEQAAEEIRNHSGRQFDPMLADAFLKNKKQFEEACRASREVSR